MAHMQKDRSTLKHRAYYSVHTGNDRLGKIVGRVELMPGRARFWKVTSRNHLTKQMEDEQVCGSFAEAKRYALEDAARWEQ